MTTSAAIRPRRSVLYMPGSNARALEKARSLDVDALILDLEDAVAPDAKDLARQQVAEAVAAGGYGHREVVIRVNGAGTPWGEADLEAAIAAGPDAILLPKVSTPADLERAAHKVNAAKAPAGLALWAMMETPLAMLNAREIAAAAANPETRLACFIMGTNDLAKETRARLVPGRAPMRPWLMACVAAARAHGLDIIDGVYNDLSDADGFAAECREGAEMGMDGKTLIHPKQVEACNAAFSPDAAEVAQARKIIAEFEKPENASKGALQVDGRMVERLHAEMGERVVRIADAIAARSAAAAAG
ncbi:HpcH/HpaI aldolase/citrate lyase family protein [Stappia indica]|uniref:HpcH/HpaI aldolase/citrate lyase family protein n=1 Tax=Stappia indica TaxID=538381 RepID=UPI001CD6BBCE|nr:CoA ester lyase [Stappia indica]MCA1300239.1 CoA ester lyase [Stappia indica]